MAHQLLMARGDGSVEWKEAAAGQYIWCYNNPTTIIDYYVPSDYGYMSFYLDVHGGGDSAYYTQSYWVEIYIDGSFYSNMYVNGDIYGYITNGVWTDTYFDQLYLYDLAAGSHVEIVVNGGGCSVIASARLVQA